MNADRWLAHFERNRDRRPEPPWAAPIRVPPEALGPLRQSLEQFQLGDGGGPACLIAWDAKRYCSSRGLSELVEHWFAEERGHSRLLLGAVKRFGGTPITGHWSFTAFCMARRLFGVRFELTVLLLTEIVSTCYYRLLQRHGNDVALRAMCKLILRDEAGHVAFHRDRLAEASLRGFGCYRSMRFRFLGLGAATMLWVNHAPCLKGLGATRREYYGEVWRELGRFVKLLRREAAARNTTRTLSSAILQPAVQQS
jgi:hypothetical protein